jgi:predicted ATP-grasp superfamily ATP-dependent carboligase
MSRYIDPSEILVQERIPGGGENQFSFCAVCREGHAYASIVAQRRRQYPVDFGNASTFVETTEQPVVEAAGRRFLESIGFDGLAEVEFKFDPRDGKYKILDVNPRTWGWHTLGKAAGMDFAYMLWRQAVGLEVAPVTTHRNATWIREITDFVSIAKSRNRMAEIKRLLKALYRGKFTSATFSLLDPIPFFAEFALWLSSGLSRQKKAKSFLQLSPAGSEPGQMAGPTPSDLGGHRPADAAAWALADERAANPPVMARISLGDLNSHLAQRSDSHASGMREPEARPQR